MAIPTALQPARRGMSCNRRRRQQEQQRRRMRYQGSLGPSFLWRITISVLLLLLGTSSMITTVQAQQPQPPKQEIMGNELATFTTPPLTPNTTHRQNVCDRYDQFRSGNLTLRYALQGLELRPILRLNEYFLYDPVTGIDPDDPGLMATLLDEISRRAGFTWRHSFAILERPTDPVLFNVTWTFTDLLAWSVDTYDIAINWWDQSVKRMERGVAFLEPWFDGSVILIDQQDPPKEKEGINLFNWLRPFKPNVWFLTILTVIMSGLCHQYLEWLYSERQERSFYQWSSDNFYLSWMNITQNYEYAPNTLSGRLFGISMGIWALVMTATYTANLASLLVESKEAPFVVNSIEEAIVMKIPICTYANTNADIFIKQNYPDAIRIPYKTELEAYEGLRRGDCGLVASYKDNWLGYQEDARYNPNCDLEWVGRTVEVIQSGFATKADAGHMCSSLIRDVINLHLTEIISAGILEEAWERHRKRISEENIIDCEVSTASGGTDEDSNGGGDDDAVRRVLARRAKTSTRSFSAARASISSRQHRRGLKGGEGGNSAASATSVDQSQEGERLTVHQMAGIFVLHFGIMALSIAIALADLYWQKRQRLKLEKSLAQKELSDTSEMTPTDVAGISSHVKHRRRASITQRVSFRNHGPIIGSPGPVNTYVQQDISATNSRDHPHPHFSSSAHYPSRLSGNSIMSAAFSDTSNFQPRTSRDEETMMFQRGGGDESHENDPLSPLDNNNNNPYSISLQSSLEATQHAVQASHQQLMSRQEEFAQQMTQLMTMMADMKRLHDLDLTLFQEEQNGDSKLHDE